MIDGQRVLGLVAARGGSRGLPGKNLAPLAGRPLLAWALRAGRQSRVLDALVFSSEDAALRDAARAHGATRLIERPAALAADDTPASPVYLHALTALRAQGEPFDVLVALSPATPFKTGADVDAALAAFAARPETPMVRTVAPAPRPPEWMFRLDDRDRAHPVLPGDLARRACRQMLAPAWVLNGLVDVIDAVALAAAGDLMRLPFVGQRCPPRQSVDIDSAGDLRRAARLAADAVAGRLDDYPEEERGWMRRWAAPE